MENNSFFIQTTHENLSRVEEILKKKCIPYDTLVWCGFFPMENSKIVLDFGGEQDNRCFIATKDFLEKSDDEIFVRLRKPNEPIRELPNFDDVFKIVEL